MIATDTLGNKGFYQVGSEIYFSKFQAILASQRSGHFPEWNFNNDVFQLWDWTTEPNESLWEIYRQRCQQLRDKYDYIVLFYSGGSDSTNILQSFLFNNIPIDEVYCYGPFKTNQGHAGQLTTDPENLWREIDVVALPYLKELSKTHKFKVTIHDTTDDIIGAFKDPDWIYTSVGSRLSPLHQGKNYLLEKSLSALQQLDSGKKVCFVSGIDKPRVMLRDDTFYFAFLDYFTTLGVGQKYQIDGKRWFVEELFYWTPDMPKLVIKQAHILKNYFLANPNQQYLIDRADLGSWKHSVAYFELVKSLVYPYWDPKTFQTSKPNFNTFLECDNWFIKGNHENRKHWLAGIQEAQKIIDPYWMSKNNDPKLTGSWSKFYTLGPLNPPG